MTDRSDEARGCLLIFGTLATSIAVGYIYSTPWGWLTAGCIALTAFLLECLYVMTRGS